MNNKLVKRLFLSALVVGAIAAPKDALTQTIRSSTVKENRALVYHGKLVRPSGQTPNGSTQVTLKIYSPDPALCLLWAETQTVNLDNGAFAIEIGHAAHRLTGSYGGAASDFKQVFINNTSLTISPATCEQGNTYTPSSTDDRLLSAIFMDGASPIEVTGLPIKSVPFALQAEEIGGYGLANLLKISGTGNNATLTPAQIDELSLMSNTDLPFDMKARLIKNAADPVDPQDVVTKSYYQANLPSGSGNGSVTNVTVASGPISVTNGTTTPHLSITQAGAAADGYLSSTHWNTFNGKLSSNLSSGQVFIGSVGNLATGGFFGIEQMRNSMGVAQMPTTCSASQTLTWTAVTDVLSCTNINNLDANKITSGTFTSARLGSGTADATTYLRGDGTWAAVPAGADHLGNHTATQNLNLGTHKLVGNGGTDGINITSAGLVGIGTNSPISGARMTVQSDTQAAVLHVNEPDDGTYIALDLRRSRSDSTNPTGNLFGVGLDFSVEGFTDGSSAPAGRILSRWENDQTDDGGSRNSTMEFLTSYGGGLNSRLTIKANGNIGVGTTTPVSALDISGQIRIAGGNPGTGKILTSDSNGLGTWTAIGNESVNTEVLVANKTLGADDPTIQIYTGLTGYTIFLPTTGVATGKRFKFISKVPFGNYVNYLIMNGSNIVEEFSQSSVKEIFFDGITWRSMATGGTGADSLYDGIGVGYRTDARLSGTSMGYISNGSNAGAAVGYYTRGDGSGAALGFYAEGPSRGAAIGYQANGKVGSVAIGYMAGYGDNNSSTYGSGNILIGYKAGHHPSSTLNLTNTLVIANDAMDARTPLIFGKFDTGNVGIGTTSPAERLSINGRFTVSGGTAPTISACGTGASISGYDNSFKVDIGTGSVTTCTVNFGSTWSVAPASCTFSAGNSAMAGAISSPTYNPHVSLLTASQVAITSGTSIASGVFYMQCF